MAGKVKLCWVRYEKGSFSKYVLLLSLGEKNGKLICLEAKPVPDWLVNSILKHRQELETLTVDERIRWVRERCEGYSDFYREVNLDNITIERTYKIGMR